MKRAMRIVSFLWSVDRLHPWLFVGALFLSPCGTALQSLLSPLIISQIINMLITGKHDLSDFIPYAVALFVSNVFGYALANFGYYLSGNLKKFGLPKLCIKAMAAILEHSIRFFTEREEGELTSKLGSLVNAHNALLSAVFNDTFNVVVRFVIATSITWFLAGPAIGLAMTLFGLGFMLLSYTSAHHRRPLIEAANDAGNQIFGLIGDIIANIVTVKAYGREKDELSRIETQGETYLEKRSRLLFDLLLGGLRVNAFIAFVKVLVLGLSVLGVVQHSLTVGGLVLVQAYLGQTESSLYEFGQTISGIQESLVESHAAITLTDAEPDVRDPEFPLSVRTEDFRQGDIALSEVLFQYKGRSVLFRNFNLRVRAGERVGVVGLSGAGKSTLASIVLRFFDVLAGHVTIGAFDVCSIKQRVLRENIAVVTQEGFLFHRSIKDNLTYGKPDASMDEIIKSARSAQIHDFIVSLPDGYNTIVGERGLELSGGERQRIAIARAILKDAPILILDEATSSLDSESEALIQEALKELMRGRTTLVIAHRLSTVQGLDRIIVLHGGRIVEEGAHTSLLELNGRYASLWRKQALI